MSSAGSILTGAAGVSKLLGLGGKRANIDAIIKRFMSQRPEGYLTESDKAFGERARARGNESIGQGLSSSRAQASRRFAARGIKGPATEQSYADLEQGAALARMGHARNVDDLLDQRFQSNLGFERNKLGAAFQAQIGEAMRRNAALDAGDAAFWKGISDQLPGMVGALGGGTGPWDPAMVPGELIGPPAP